MYMQLSPNPKRLFFLDSVVCVCLWTIRKMLELCYPVVSLESVAATIRSVPFGDRYFFHLWRCSDRPAENQTVRIIFIPDQPYWQGGWIRVNAAEYGQQDILESIRQGNFYATQGPGLKTIQIEDAGGKRAWSNPLWFSDNIPVP